MEKQPVKITFARKKGKEITLNTVAEEVWVEKVRTEAKGRPVSAFREQLRHLLPGSFCDADKLPMVMPAAEFRRIGEGGGMKRYNGIVELTVGPLSGSTEIALVKQCAWEQPQTRCVFTGSSGRSVKIWTTFTRPDNSLPETQEEAERFHAHAYRQAVRCYQPQLPFDILPREPRLDQYSRLSFDPDLLYRPDSVQFYLSQPASMPGEQTYREAVQQEKSPLARALPGLEECEAARLLFEAALRKAYEEVDQAEADGALPDETQQAVMTRLAYHCFRSGLPEEEAVRQTIFHYYLKHQTLVVRELFRNIYRKTPRKAFGICTALNREQLISIRTDEFMKRRYDFRFNTMMGEVEHRERHSFRFRFQPLDARALNSIALDAQSEGIPLWDRDVSRYIYSNRVPLFNPLEDYLYTLPRWDGKDRIGQLARTVPCCNPHWERLFHRWFLSMVSHWRGSDSKYANSVSPLLVGAQGTRKSTFCRSLVPPELRAYYTDSIDFARKRDAELSLTRFALINIDEFDQISPQQQGFLKHVLQKPVVNVRKPYASAMIEMRRYASFIATSNQKDLLTDPSGSRRFICIEVAGAIDTSRPIDYARLYAQAMHELDQGERYWFDHHDEALMNEANREFEQVPPEMQLFYRYFRPAGADEEGEWLSPAEILEEIRRHSVIPVSVRRVSVFGRLLQKDGVRSKRVQRGTVYCVVRER